MRDYSIWLLPWGYGLTAVFIAGYGVKLFYDGIRGGEYDLFVTLNLPDWLLFIGGLICLVPLSIYVYVALEASG